MTAYFEIDDVNWIASEARRIWANDPGEHNRLYHLMGQQPQPELRLPHWLDLSMDPYGPDYRNEILKLWQAVFDRGSGSAGAHYDIGEHEQDAAYNECPIRFPGYFARRDPGAVQHAGYELAMLGDIFLHSGLSSGKHALEYGSGPGNVAINLSRMGVSVDTVDISTTYCEHIARNAEFYGTALTPFNLPFGANPRGEDFRYDCIIFHAAFHHSLDHAALIGSIAQQLKDDCVILLSNEPIYDDFYCPWGLRLDPECISVIAGRGWMELGFRFDYLRNQFCRHGLHLYRIRQTFSGIPLYAARKVASHISFALGDYPADMLSGVHGPEPIGTWTTGSASIPIAPVAGANKVVVQLANFLPFEQEVTCLFGDDRTSMSLPSGGEATIELLLNPSQPPFVIDLILQSSVVRPSERVAGSTDDRELGILLRSLTYS
ncbi:hypothetical protein SLG_21160 [Sphingobium sp. SYK-6]|uniref:class I SAM-dependent methyltransferase n=1 Tax=Sphingobium sp. (strain NBRC 103272 / SYK-6) TaxID=627192 RepID=UPI0002276EE5|nr:methyltransferase domain-containing protein [Sphingobium sp. SYK-6]BAK66791.1 hypothetical protein SLG_21160 [Sphingobium sp. SYK-6]